MNKPKSGEYNKTDTQTDTQRNFYYISDFNNLAMGVTKLKPAKSNFAVRVNFNLRNTTPASQVTPVRCIVRYNNQKIVLPSYFSVEPRHWNVKQQTVRSNYTDDTAKKITAKVALVRSEIKKLFDEYIDKHRKFPPNDYFKQLVISKVDKAEGSSDLAPVDLVGFTETFISNAENEKVLTVKGKPYAENTLKIYRTLKKNLISFKEHKDFNTIDLNFAHLGLAFFEEYKEYMSSELDYSKNTIAKHIRVLKVLLTEAKEQNLIQAEFKGKRYQAPTEETESIYLNDAEIQAMVNLDLTDEPSLDRIRDLFLVGCWTGLRFSDFHNISPKCIIGESIEIKTQKTGVKVVVPIHSHIRTLMEKYSGKTANSLPPTISIQKLNEGIKKVGDKAGIKEIIQIKITKGGQSIVKNLPKFSLISSHTARRSFASNMYLANASTISIMAITGHKTESSFMKYIRVTPKEHSEKIREIWQNKATLKVVS